MGWLYQNKIFKNPETYVGFVYLITNLKTDKKYIGKKLFTMAGYKQVNKKRKKLRKPSDWKDYFGSNASLQEDVKVLGKRSFKREILKLCTTRSECTYYETLYILSRYAIIDPMYYNEWVTAKITRKHVANLWENIKEIKTSD